MDRRAVIRALLALFILISASTGSADESPSVAKPSETDGSGKDEKLSTDEQAVLDAAKAERDKEKLPALKTSSVLMQAARDHAANMAKQKILSHTLDEKPFAKRMEEAGYKSWTAGENIAEGQSTGKEAVAGWMMSPGHKANILSKDYTEIGIGHAVSGDGEHYWVQIFGRPQTEKPPVKDGAPKPP